MEEAQEGRAPTQKLIDRFARWYTPPIIAASVVLFIITRRIELALTMLAISCPGALVVSTPVAVVAGIGRAAREGILIRGGEYLERAGKIHCLGAGQDGHLERCQNPRSADILTLGQLPPAPVVNGAPAEQGGGVGGLFTA